MTSALKLSPLWVRRSKSFVNDQNIEEEIEKKEKEPFIVIPYVMGVSEELRRVCGKYGVRDQEHH